MKTTSFLTAIVFLLNFAVKSYAQGEAAVPFLLLNPSPSLSAMGATGSALPTNDPFGFLWNPAQLGYTSQTNNLTFIFYPTPVDWIPSFNLDRELSALAFNAGYNFKDLIGFPLSFGFGYSNPELNFGTFNRNDENGNKIGEFEAKDYYNAYSFGLGMDYYVQLSIGYTIKNVKSVLSNEFSAETTVNDFGILLNVPVIKLINKNLLLPIDGKLNGKPTFDFSLGYSKSNIGDEIYYVDPVQSDPLPRTDRTGYGLSAGFDLISDNFSINAFNLSFTVEAEDLLVSRDSTGNSEYEPTLSDLQFWKNIIKIEGTQKIVSRAGTKLEFVESVALYFGHFSGRGFYSEITNGYELRAKGLFKLSALWAKNSITDFLRDHIDIIYYNTNYFEYDWTETKMTGLALYVHNLNELFE
ncbi:MAG: hypothetical protein HND39_12020 [Ignavibacteriota bacterium]|nr:MAG: hypothetical protein EDM72_14425 [Chlorobiota bacterium]MBE7477005.1 hypothetical protein [Ignavibacteriales bacterium]MBL1121745.1 hypothetical protein [Ignavibacteriota bacterium]MCC7094733.1 hypothetical protein [Ignavibacteriaceae bacterium]MEB2297535.1 hypothetical protein [Ignavibacteria bacterium]